MERRGKLQGVVCGSLRHDLSEHIKRHAEAAKVTGGYKPGLMVCSDVVDQGSLPAIPEGQATFVPTEAASSAEGGAVVQQSSRVAMMAESPPPHQAESQDLTPAEIACIMGAKAVYGTSGVQRLCMMGDAYCNTPCPCVNCPDTKRRRSRAARQSDPVPPGLLDVPPPPPHEAQRPPRPEAGSDSVLRLKDDPDHYDGEESLEVCGHVVIPVQIGSKVYRCVCATVVQEGMLPTRSLRG